MDDTVDLKEALALLMANDELLGSQTRILKEHIVALTNRIASLEIRLAQYEKAQEAMVQRVMQ